MSGATDYRNPPLFVREYRHGRALCVCGCGQPVTLIKVNHARSGMVKGKPYRYVARHAGKRRSDPVARFWSYVDKTDHCWNWTGATRYLGYPALWDGDRQVAAYRFSYELHVGPIPEGLTIDHLCRNPKCVNPAHLEPVTMEVNNARSDSPSARNARKTHCKYGHPLFGDNLHIGVGKNGAARRDCKACWARKRALYAERKRELATEGPQDG